MIKFKLEIIHWNLFLKSAPCSSHSFVCVCEWGVLHTQLLLALTSDLTLIAVFVHSALVLSGRYDIAAILGEGPSEACFQSWCMGTFSSLSQVAMGLLNVFVQGCPPGPSHARASVLTHNWLQCWWLCSLLRHWGVSYNCTTRIHAWCLWLAPGVRLTASWLHGDFFFFFNFMDPSLCPLDQFCAISHRNFYLI